MCGFFFAIDPNGRPMADRDAASAAQSRRFTFRSSALILRDVRGRFDFGVVSWTTVGVATCGNQEETQVEETVPKLLEPLVKV